MSYLEAILPKMAVRKAAKVNIKEEKKPCDEIWRTSFNAYHWESILNRHTIRETLAWNEDEDKVHIGYIHTHLHTEG